MLPHGAQNKEQLDKHRKKYCQGSALHKATIATREDTAGYLAPSDWNEEAVNNLTKGLKALDDTSQQLSIADLMRKLEHEAADKRAERKQQELSAQRAAERLAAVLHGRLDFHREVHGLGEA